MGRDPVEAKNLVVTRMRHPIRTAFAVAATMPVFGLASAAGAGNPNPGVAPINSSAYGHSYGGWSAEWWKWFLSIPTPDHPGIGGDCGVAQSGPVFFLAADFTGSEGVPCTIPAGGAVLFAPANVECSTVEPPPFHGDNEEELRACAKCWADQIVVSSLEATLDGEALSDLGSYRVASPLFTFEYPADNIFGIPGGPGTGQSVSDGYWLLLNPLSAGSHTLSFSGAFEIPAEGACGADGPASFGFGAVYELTVEGGGTAGRR
jgi:hypothetical protein